MSKSRSAFVVFLISIALIGPSQVGAGGSVSFASYETEFISDRWLEWFGVGDMAIPPSAKMTARIDTTCLRPEDPDNLPGLGADGDEFNFSFGLFGDNCLSGDAIDRRPIAVFSWQYFDVNNLRVLFPCLDVWGSVSSGDIPGARIVFEPDVTVDVTGANVTGDRLTDITELEFALEIPYVEPGSVAAQGVIGTDDFLISISISPCNGGWDGPDIDIEHYRRMAEQATALPDTL